MTAINTGGCPPYPLTEDRTQTSAELGLKGPAPSDKSLIDFIEMLVNRLSNLENKFDNLLAMQEHEDNLKGPVILSGMRHCDPPRYCIINKHYSDDISVEHSGYVYVDSFTDELPFDQIEFDTTKTKWVINPKRLNDLKLVFGNKFELLEKSLDNLKIPVEESDYDDYPAYDSFPSEYNLFTKKYSCCWSEMMDRFVRKKFTNVVAVGEYGMLVNKDTVRNVMNTIDSVFAYFDVPKPTNIRLYTVCKDYKKLAVAVLHKQDVKSVFDAYPPHYKRWIENGKDDLNSILSIIWNCIN